jgi:hypothetical protein
LFQDPIQDTTLHLIPFFLMVVLSGGYIVAFSKVLTMLTENLSLSIRIINCEDTIILTSFTLWMVKNLSGIEFPFSFRNGYNDKFWFQVLPMSFNSGYSNPMVKVKCSTSSDSIKEFSKDWLLEFQTLPEQLGKTPIYVRL